MNKRESDYLLGSCAEFARTHNLSSKRCTFALHVNKFYAETVWLKKYNIITANNVNRQAANMKHKILNIGALDAINAWIVLVF